MALTTPPSTPPPTPAAGIQASLGVVARLRDLRLAQPPLQQAVLAVKRFQAARFQATYADLMTHPRYCTATSFFLTEVYGDKDYGERDQQFSRIAVTLEKLFPQAVIATAATLVELHALTETLDDAMAKAWLADIPVTPQAGAANRYVRCWRQVGDDAARQRQLAVVLQLGRSLDRLTRTPGLRTLLRMMRRPAAAAGLTALQQFLENGFDAFAAMRGADEFLAVVARREADWMTELSTGDAVACETRLDQLLTAPGR